MSETTERKITFEIELPHDFRIVRYGSSDSLELESLEENYEAKTRKPLGTKSWKFVGYYTYVDSALRGYMKNCPKLRMKGKYDLGEVVKFLKEIEDIAMRLTSQYD